MLNMKKFSLWVTALAVSIPWNVANAIPTIESPEYGTSGYPCYKPSGTCKSGYTLSADGKSCVADVTCDSGFTLVQGECLPNSCESLGLYTSSLGVSTSAEAPSGPSGDTVTISLASGNTADCSCDYDEMGMHATSSKCTYFANGNGSCSGTTHPYLTQQGIDFVCYKLTCNSGYSLSSTGQCVADTDPCEPDNYEDFVSALGNSACTTVTLANDIDATDKAVTTLRMLDNQTLDGNGKTLMLNSTITLGGSSNIKNLTLISEASYALDISQGGNLLSDINVQSTGNALKMNAPYMMSGYNTLTAYGSNAVGLYSSTFGVLTLFSDASLDINASGGATGIQLANNSEIVVEEGATLDINVMDGYAIADIEGLLNIDGTLNIDHDGPQSPIYGASSTLTIEGDGDINIVTNSGSDTINIANLMVYLDGTLNIEAPIANGAYFINSSNGSFNFYSGSSKLITKSTGSRTLSDTDAGINIMVHELSSNAIWQVTGSGYNTTWRVNGNDLNCLYGYNKSYPTGSCWVSILSTDPA